MIHPAKQKWKRIANFCLKYVPSRTSLCKSKHLIRIFIPENKALHKEEFFLSIFSHWVSWMRPQELSTDWYVTGWVLQPQCGMEGKGVSGNIHVMKQRGLLPLPKEEVGREGLDRTASEWTCENRKAITVQWVPTTGRALRPQQGIPCPTGAQRRGGHGGAARPGSPLTCS